MDREPKLFTKATRKDVAKLAGTSEQTVSYILNDSRQFSPKLVDAVKRAIEELNYQPDMIARSMVKKRSKLISIAVDDISNPIFGEIIRGFEESAAKFGYFVNIMDIRSDFLSHVSSIVSRRVDGIYLSLIPSKSTELFIKNLLNAGIKVLLGNHISKEVEDRAIFAIVDLYNGMRTIIDYLAGLGHRDIVYVSGLDIHSGTDDRYRGFIERCRELFGKEPAVITNEAPFNTDMETGFRLAEKLFESGLPCTAIIATNDLMAYGILKACKRRGITVGKDISVVGIDDIFFSESSDPPLTSLGFNKKAYGERLFLMLKQYIEEKIKPDNKNFTCNLVERNSVKNLNL